jgi:hypothetical protein
MHITNRSVSLTLQLEAASSHSAKWHPLPALVQCEVMLQRHAAHLFQWLRGLPDPVHDEPDNGTHDPLRDGSIVLLDKQHIGNADSA